MNPKVDFYFSKNVKWQAEINKLRTIVLSQGLDEELKWGVPCYTFNGNNIVLIHVFKEYCALLFIKGVLLRDNQGILIRQTDNVRSARQIRFTNLQQVLKLEATIGEYIREAIEVEKAGLKVDFDNSAKIEYPAELQDRFTEMPALKEAFEALTPGRRRAYVLHFSAAKQTKTRVSRIEKCVDLIMEGIGLDDRYDSSSRSKSETK